MKTKKVILKHTSNDRLLRRNKEEKLMVRFLLTVQLIS